MNKSALAAPSKPQLLGFLLMLVFLAVGLGYGYYHKQRHLAVTRAQNELAAIANLKVSQVVNWRQERQSQGNAIAGNPLIVNQVRQFLAEPAAPQKRQDLETWLTALRSEYGFRTVSVYDAAGKCHLMVPPSSSFSNMRSDEMFLRALHSKSAIISDLHRGQVDRSTHLSIWIPIGKKPELDAPADGILNLQIDPSRFLYPLIQTWPTLSSTAETLLLRREGEDVLYLNNLMQRTNAAMALRLPINRPNFPAGQAAMGREGVMEGVDYRGVSVLAAMRRIPNTGWALVAKVDQEEILAPIRAYAWIAVFITAMVVLAAVMGTLALWRKRELLENRQRLALQKQIETILRVAKIGLDIVDPQYHVLFVDAAKQEKLGPVGARKCYEYFQKGDAPCPGCGVTKALESGQTVVFDRQVINEDRYEQVTLIPIEEPTGERVFYEVVLDITERKRVEDALREREAQYRTILHTAMDGFWLVDMEGRLLAVNEAYCRLSGYEQESLLKMRIRDLELLETSADTLAHVEKIRTLGQDRFETKHRRKDGSTFQVEVSVQYRPEGGGQMYAFIRDITAKKQAEEALLESEKRFLAFMHHLPAAAFIKDPDGRTLFANQYLADLFGFKNWECKTTTELVGGTIGQQMVESDRKAFEQGPLKLEETVLDFQGVGRTFETIKFPIFMQGKPALLGGISRDITERKQAAERLRDSETKYRRLVDNCPDTLYIFSEQKGGIFYSRQVENLLGYSIDYLYSHPLVWSESIHPDDLANVRQVFNEAASCKPFMLEYRLRDAQGNWRWIYDRSIARYQQNGDTFIEGLATDITERKRMEAENARLEAQLRQSQKQEAIGQLAGGVAHDFNNILAAMMMNIGSLEQNPNLDAETQESLKELLAEAERAASLTRQLLLFSRKSVMEKKVLDLNEVVANLLKMLGRLIGEHVSLRFERANGLPWVEADQGMIEQVLMNLAVNARDAMPNGGRLAISLKIVPIGAEGIKGQADVLPGTFICLAVQDTGCGMDQATQNKIFEPFFTTKEVGKGTGLGLATVYGIAALHKGWVEVESEVGQGTTFRVYLPQRMQGIAEPDQTVKRELFRGQETILLVEDNDAVRRMSVRGLKGLGYQVLEAHNGLAGLKLWQEHPGQINLLLTDMVMPEGLTGLALAEQLKAEKPNLKVIICSGYNEDMSGQTTAELKGIQYLQKPYSVALLSKKVRECLDGA